MDEPKPIIKKYTTNLNNWYILGKYAINKNSLAKNTLNVKHKRTLTKLGSQIAFTNVRKISDACVDFLNDVAHNKDRFDMSLFFALDNDEQKLMIELLERSAYGNEIGFNYVDAYKNRMKVLQGHLAVGNLNKDVGLEAIAVIKKLVSLHVISHTNGTELMNEIKEAYV